LILFIITLPGLILSTVFIFSNKEYEAPKYMDQTDLLKGIVELSPIITLNYEKEKVFAQVIFFCLCFLIGLIFYNNIGRKTNTTIQSNNSGWLIAAAAVLVLYFVLPDWMVSGGFISIRLGLFFFLVLIIWIATSWLSVKQIVGPVVIIIITSVCFVKYHYEEVKKLSDDVREITLADNFIEEGKTLLPLNYSTNWLHGNFSNYLGTQKFILVLDNYEATKPHFPLKWKKDQNPYTLIGNFGNTNPCIKIEKYETQTGHAIDYISRWYYNNEISDSCSSQVNQLLQEKFNLIYTSPKNKIQLFKRKQ